MVIWWSHQRTFGRGISGYSSYSKWGAFIDEFDQFDPLFFNIAPREAENIDPQGRLFLEECWKALEDAGYAPANLPPEIRQKAGVFAGVTKPGFPLTPFAGIVNRVSYYLNFQGPSIPVDTMCSSSLAAIHEACEYIRQGKGVLAIAGGVNLYLHPDTYIGLSMQQLLSNTSRSAAFAKGGTGFVPGEGVGAIVLKAYGQARKDGDHIYALIRGTAVNHNGKTNGYMMPNPNQQAAVIQNALAQANIDPRGISYIESAANGSEMNDAVEMTALMKVFSGRNGTEGSYTIGSVKPNIGHCEAASGISQLLKVIFSLRHKTLLPTLHCGEWNPKINFNRLPFQVQLEVSAWHPVRVDGVEVPRRAGITNVGAGGVNAHLIIEEFIPETVTPDSIKIKSEHTSKRAMVFILSAKNKDRLTVYVKRWLDYLKNNQNAGLESLTYTLQVGREEMPCRLAVVTHSQAELIAQLEQYLEERTVGDNIYWGDLTNHKPVNPDAAQIIKTEDPAELAKLWVLGNSISWYDLYRGKLLSRLAQLPAYPFERKVCRKERCPISSQPADYPVESLPESEIIITGKEKNEPYTELEKSIAAIWARELGLREINIYTNFLEMGGNSLLAIKLEVELSKRGWRIEATDISLYPSIAGIASFISQKAGQVVNRKKILAGVNPYNDLYYKDCFYNALFSAIQHFNKDIIPFLINDVAVYAFPLEPDDKLLKVNYQSTAPIQQLLNDQHIVTSTRLKSDKIISDIITGISNNRPVIAAIDCFYAPLREDLYQKEHWAHYWLVYGYDGLRQMFNIIEHRHRGSLTYKQYEVSYQDLANCYTGFIKNFPMAGNEPSYYEFDLGNEADTAELKGSAQYRHTLAMNILNHKRDLADGLAALQVFLESYREIAADGQKIQNNSVEIIEMLNEIINARKADRYKLQALFSEMDGIAMSLDQVITSWDLIRRKLARCMYTGEYDPGPLEVVSETLGNVYEYEREYYNLLLSFLARI